MENNDYKKIVERVIKTKLKKKTPFVKLDSLEQRVVIRHLSDNKINVKVFGYKWFDVLQKTFVIEEYSTEGKTFFDDYKDLIKFDSFDAFFQYINGDIYENACFFGYIFSQEEIEKYDIDLKKINCSSFITETISKYTFDYVKKSNSDEFSLVAKRAARVFDFLEACPKFENLKEFTAFKKLYTKRFEYFEYSESIFFSVILNKFGKSFKDIAIQYFCKEGRSTAFDISEVLFYFGREAAEYVLNNYIGTVSYNTRRQHIAHFKFILEKYDSGLLEPKRTTGFNKKMQLYVVYDECFSNNRRIISIERYFIDFQKYVAFLGGDLSGALLVNAPVTKEEVLKYKTDDKTQFPRADSYSKYKISSYFKDNLFFVEQKWGDDSGALILKKEHSFDKFFDYVYFLENDLSSSDLIMCEGIENIKHIQNIKMEGARVRSGVAKLLQISSAPLRCSEKPTEFQQTEQFELATVNTFLSKHTEDENYGGKVSYITDIHLLHRFDANKCATREDEDYVINTIAETIDKENTGLCLIGGDTSSDFDAFKTFVGKLKTKKDDKRMYFFNLGNHELWPLCDLGLNEIFKEYREILSQNKMFLVQNNIFYFGEHGLQEINETELASIDPFELRNKLKQAKLIIFGGVGFAGKNESFNANQGIYLTAINREQEIEQSELFLSLYKKVTSSLYDKNVIVFTHMPMRDWAGDLEPQPKFVYISGHSHRNYYFDNGIKRIYSDNQIGYKGKSLSLKTAFLNFDYDWFSDYKDGIYEIDKNDYETFYRGIGEGVTFNRPFQKLYMIKREGTYMFIMQSPKGRMCIMNGGSIKKAGNHSLDYFYENIVKYSKSVNMFLSKYDAFQKKVSAEIKALGGSGWIHGCIVDINFYNHLYINPLDGSITPYFALSMVDKYVYPNIQSLLKYQCPSLYTKYEEITSSADAENSSLVLYNPNASLSNKKVAEYSTEMYRVSRILNGLQFTTKYNIVRLWSEALVSDPSETSGKLIVSGIINPDSLPEIENKKPVVAKVSTKSRSLGKKFIQVEKKTKEQMQEDKALNYEKLVSKQTNNTIKVIAYRGSKEKADYKCTVCGHEWSMRTDHFRDRRNYTCPNCSKQKKIIPVEIKWDDEKIVAEQKQEPVVENNERVPSTKENVTEKKHQNVGIKTIRKEKRNDDADLIVLTFISENGEDAFTTRQLARAMERANVAISKNAVINAVTRLLENNDLYLSLNGCICISIKGSQRLKNKK